MSTNTKGSQSLTFEEQLIDEYETYDTNHYTGSQVSLFLGPVWIEEFVAIRYTERNSKRPLYGWNEMYSDMNLDGNYLINGVFTVNNVETDLVFRTIEQLRKELADNDNKESIDKIIEQQSSKFKARLESRLLEQKEKENLDYTDVSKLIERAKDRVDVVINELVNQNDNVFNYDLSVVTGNHRDVNPNIQIFEHFNILEKQVGIEPDDTPLMATYSFYARKARSRRTSNVVTIKPVQTKVDLLRMIQEICTQLTSGFTLDNKEKLLELMSSIKSANPTKNISIYDVYNSQKFERKRGLLDLPLMSFENKSANPTELSAKINKTDIIGYTGLVKNGTNSYGENISLNKIAFNLKLPETFEIDQTIYGNQYLSDGAKIDVQSKALSETYKVIIENYGGEIIHPDHQILETFGYDIIGEIFPSPFSVRSSGIPVRKPFLYKDAATQESMWKSIYNYKNRSYITNSFLSIGEPIVKIKSKSFSGKDRKDTTVIKMPLFSFTYFNFKEDSELECDAEKPELKLTMPMQIYMVDYYKNLKDEQIKKQLNKSLVGEDGKDFYLIPIKHYGYYNPGKWQYDDGTNMYNIITSSHKGADFDYENITPSKLDSIIKTVYAKDPKFIEKLQPLEKSLHLIPLKINYERYLKKFEPGVTLYEFFNEIQNPKRLKKVLLNILSKLKTEPDTDIFESSYNIHCDYLFKNITATSPGEVATNIEMSFIHGIRKDENSHINNIEDDSLLVIYFLIVSKTANFQNNRDVLKMIEDKSKEEGTTTRFINSKGFSTEFKFDDYVQPDNGEPRKEPHLYFTYEIGNEISIENYIRTDFINYNIQDSALDTFLNFITPDFQWVDNLFGGGFKNIIRYSREMQIITGNNLDPNSHWLLEFTGYLKSLAGGVLEQSSKLLSYLKSETINDFFNGPITSYLLAEEEISVKELNNVCAFAGDIYVNINIRKCAESIVYSLRGQENVSGSPNGKKVWNNSYNLDVHNNTNNTGMKASVKSTAQSFPEEELIQYTMNTLRKKLLDFNTEDNNKIEIRTNRFMSNPEARVIKQKPEFTDPNRKETIYVKFNSAFPMDKSVIKYAKNQDKSGIDLKVYTFPEEDIF